MTTEACEGVVLTPIYGGFHIKTLEDGSCIHILKTLLNWRLQQWHGPCDCLSSHGGYYWCYQGLGRDVFQRAVSQAIAWNGDPSNPPTGWIKSYTGEYGPELRR